MSASAPTPCPAQTSSAPVACWTSFLATYITIFPAVRRNTPPTSIWQSPRYLFSGINGLDVDASKQLLKPLFAVCMFLLQRVLMKVANDFRRSNEQ